MKKLRHKHSRFLKNDGVDILPLKKEETELLRVRYSILLQKHVKNRCFWDSAKPLSCLEASLILLSKGFKTRVRYYLILFLFL